LIGLGDSYTSGGGSQSYPLVAGKFLNWQARNFAVGGSKMNAIAAQLAKVGSLLSNVTHIVLTTSGNDLGVSSALQEIILKNNATGVENKILSLQPQLVSTFKIIQDAVRPGTKIHALPYVDFISVGNKIPNEDKAHEVMKVFANMIQIAAQEVKIEYIEAVLTAFLGHEMYSPDLYCNSFNEPNAAHPNLKGYYKIGEVVADYLKSH
jgi:lysophospholipase L1-like esterase